MNLKACKYDRDCPGVESCYSGTVWIDEENFPNGNNTIRNCYCSTYFGVQRNAITGECTEFTNITYGFIALDVVYLILSFIGLVVSAFMFYKTKVFTNLTLNASTTTLIFVFLAFLLTLFEIAIDLKSIYTTIYPSNIYCDMLDETSDKCGPYDLTINIFDTFVVVFTALASLNIGLIWIELSSITGPSKIGNVTKYRRPMFGISFVYFLLILIVGAIIGLWEYTVYISVPFFFGIVICYTYGFHMMSYLLKTQISANVALPERIRKRNKLVLQEIRRTSIMVIFVALLLIGDIIGFTYFAFQYWKDYAPINELSISASFDYAGTMFALLLDLIILRYLYLTSSSRDHYKADSVDDSAKRFGGLAITTRTAQSLKIVDTA